MPKVVIEVDLPERQCLRCKKTAPCKVGAFADGWGNVPQVIREPEGWLQVILVGQKGALCGDCGMSFAEWLEIGSRPGPPPEH